MNAFGPRVSKVLVNLIGGQAQRSDLEIITDPLRKLVFHRSLQAKGWLQQALIDPGFPSHKVSKDDKDFWLRKVMRYA